MNSNEPSFYKKPASEVLEALETDIHGLSAEEAERRLERFGPNALPEAKPDGIFKIFLRQFQSPLIYILLAASGIVFALGDTVDGFIILFVLVFNAVIGAVQEGKAQNTLQALKKMVETEATVLRDGSEFVINAKELVPGDVIILDEGQKVPADARLISVSNLSVSEAALTGESTPVEKLVELPDKLRRKSELQTSEQQNMAWKGTSVAAGLGRAVIVSTGTNTVIGKISKEIAAIDTEIPLKANIRNLARLIVVATAAVSVVLFVSGLLWFGKTIEEMFKLVVALAVSFIPEGLPVALTLILVTGVWRMAKRNALVRKLQAVEALGQAKVLAVDKTGTITKNELVIQRVYVAGKMFQVTGEGYEPKGDFIVDESHILPADSPEILFAGKVAAFTANAHVSWNEEEKIWRVSGDPTEAAILVFGEKTGFRKEDMEERHPLVSEIPFDYKLKYRAAVRKEEKGKLLTVVGAPEVILEKSKIKKGEAAKLTEVFHNLSKGGFRVLAFGWSKRPPEEITPDTLPKLTFGGFYGMMDALRPEVRGAMDRAEEAGMKVVMITGDHRLTAEAIAREADIHYEGDLILTGEDLDKMSDDELARVIDKVSVFARVAPEHKLRIIRAFKERGDIIAMTGDGVNDAPSLVAADLGVAMGKIGTEVAKEAADIVLLDDNFGSVVSAVEEGRSIYRTIRKVLQYLFSTNIGEVLLISFALFMGYPLPLLAGQIIWLNFVTDGFLVASLAMEPKEKGLLSGKFRKAKQLVDGPLIMNSLVIALVISFGSFFVFTNYVDGELVKAQTMVLTTMAVFQWFRVWNVRSEEESVFKLNPFSNMFLVAATVIVIILQLGAVYLPFMNAILRTAPIAAFEWLFIAAVAASVFVVEEARKFIVRKLRRTE